jgi:hypothetical protein
MRVREYNFGKRNLLEACGFRESAAVTTFDPRAERELWLSAGPLRELRALGTRFVVSAPGAAAVFGAREVLVDPRWQFAIHEIPEAPPLVFRPERVVQGSPHFGTTVSALQRPPKPHEHDPSARLVEVRDEPARIDLRVEQSKPGYWVLSFTLDRDWRAEVDGKPAEIERADGVRRALWMPAGEHLATLVYRPVLLLSLFALSLCAYALAGAVYASRRTPGAAI